MSTQQQYDKRTKRNTQEEETTTPQTHRYSDEASDGRSSDTGSSGKSGQRKTSGVTVRKSSKVSIGPKTTSNKVSVRSAPAVSAKPKPSGPSSSSDQSGDDKKRRRRDKNASSDILSVIDWKRGEGDDFTGADTVPDVDDVNVNERESNKNERNEQNRSSSEAENTPVRKSSTITIGGKKNTSSKIKVASAKSSAPKQEESKPYVNGIHHENNETKSLPNGLSKYDKYLNEDDMKKPITDEDVEESLKFLKSLPKVEDIEKMSDTDVIGNLMETYLSNPPSLSQTTSASQKSDKESMATISSDYEKLEELERNLRNIRASKKKIIPPTRLSSSSKGVNSWEDPMEQQRPKTREKEWPPREEPQDKGAYIVESYGQTDPYSKKLIKDIQKQKREEEEKKMSEKRAEIVEENVNPVSKLKSIYTNQPSGPRPGVQKPDAVLDEETSWIKHEKKQVVFDAPPDEPDWMKLIRNRRWRSTVKARFPCKDKDRTEFERRSTTPKNWKRLAKDKTAMRIMSEIVGIGPEGEELFTRLASQRQKIEDEQETLDRLAEQELMAYEVARESLGEDAAYSLQMDNPLPAARMKRLPTPSSTRGSISESDVFDTESNASYPFTTSQLEAAFLTNQLLKLHPEEFRKLMSLERSRQATLRWQFSSDPFDSVHEHQSLPFEIALLASEEPRVQQAMKKILSQSQNDEYRTLFSESSTPVPTVRRTRSMTEHRGYYSDLDGYESGQSSNSGVMRGRRKKKPVPPPVRPRLRSASPNMMAARYNSSENLVSATSGNKLSVPRLNADSAKKQLEDDKEIHSHGLLTDEEMKLSEEIAKLQEMTSNIGRDIDEELKGIENSLSDAGSSYTTSDFIDLDEIAARRREFMSLDRQNQNDSNIQISPPKVRHKVRRINSATQLDAVFRRRRQMSESNLEKEDDEKDQNNNDISDQTDTKAGEEIANLAKNITDTYASGADD